MDRFESGQTGLERRGLFLLAAAWAENLWLRGWARAFYKDKDSVKWVMPLPF
jgi:hypothetical protein